MNIRLLVVDDHEMVRVGLRYALGDTEMEIVEATDGLRALEILFDQRVDIVLLDIDLLSKVRLTMLSFHAFTHAIMPGSVAPEQWVIKRISGAVLRWPTALL